MKKITLEDRIKKLKSLKQYRGKSIDELKELANLQIQREKLKVDWIGLTNPEIKFADKLYANYIDHHHIELFNDIEDLKTLVFNTLLENRIKIDIAPKINKETKELEFRIPSKMATDSLTNIQKQNLDLKNKLGLNKSKKLGWLDFWGGLCEKINAHAVHNRGAFTFKCPSCGKLTLLLRKVSDYNTFDFGIFRGTAIYSKKMMELIDDKKITFEDAAAIFGVSPEYINGCYEKIYLKEKGNDKK